MSIAQLLESLVKSFYLFRVGIHDISNCLQVKEKWENFKITNIRFSTLIDYSIEILETRFPLQLSNYFTAFSQFSWSKWCDFSFIKNTMQRRRQLPKCLQFIDNQMLNESVCVQLMLDDLFSMMKRQVFKTKESNFKLKVRKTSTFDLLNWWKLHEKLFPKLSAVSRRLL